MIEMYGDTEPWWFFEDWEKDVVATRTFENYYEALKYYKTIWVKWQSKLPFYQSRSYLMTIFWNPSDKRWCDECNEYLQQYYSIALLEDDHQVAKSKFRPGYQKQNAKQQVKICKLKR